MKHGITPYNEFTFNEEQTMEKWKNVRPLGGRVLVVRDETVSVTKGGILLPDQAKEKPTKGTVLLLGPGEWNRDKTGRAPMELSVGDTVYFNQYGGSRLDLEDGKEYVVIREEEIIAAYREDK